MRSSAPVIGHPVEGEDEVAGSQTGAIGGACRLDGRRHHRALLPEGSGVTQPPRDGGLLRGDADEGAAHAAVADQFAEHEACGVGGDRKADALRAHDHRGVDADDLAARRTRAVRRNCRD